jgi:hypothetical protein
MPSADRLPRSIRRLSEIHAVELRHTRFDEDVGYLVDTLEAIVRRPATELQPLAPPSPPPLTTAVPTPSRISGYTVPGGAAGPMSDASVPSPDERHYETVARFLFDEGTVVPVLGARVYGSLPDADEIAADLARRFELQPEPLECPGSPSTCTFHLAGLTCSEC